MQKSEAHILINFDKCISPWNHHPNHNEHFHQSGKFSHLFQLSLNTQGQLLFWLLSLWTHFACSLTSSVQRHGSYIFVTVFFHSTSCFRDWSVWLNMNILHSMNMPQLNHFTLSGHWLFLLFGNYEYCLKILFICLFLCWIFVAAWAFLQLGWAGANLHSKC